MCCYLDRLISGASMARCELAKGRSDDGGSAASLMIKSTNIWRGSVGTLIVGSPERQVVGVLIVRFP